MPLNHKIGFNSKNYHRETDFPDDKKFRHETWCSHVIMWSCNGIIQTNIWADSECPHSVLTFLNVCLPVKLFHIWQCTNNLHNFPSWVVQSDSLILSSFVCRFFHCPHHHYHHVQFCWYFTGVMMYWVLHRFAHVSGILQIHVSRPTRQTGRLILHSPSQEA